MQLSHLHSFLRAVVPEIVGVGVLEDNSAGFKVFNKYFNKFDGPQTLPKKDHKTLL